MSYQTFRRLFQLRRFQLFQRLGSSMGDAVGLGRLALFDFGFRLAGAVKVDDLGHAGKLGLGSHQRKRVKAQGAGQGLCPPLGIHLRHQRRQA